MKDLKKEVNEVREMIDKLNAMTKDLEGEGCDVHYHINEPFNRIDFVAINKTVKF